MHSIQLKFAKQKLIFYVAQDLDQTIRSNVEQLVNEVAASRIWSVTPPSYIDEIDENGAEVVGGILEIYSALPPNILPIEMDSKNLDDVEALVGAVKNYLKKKIFLLSSSWMLLLLALLRTVLLIEF